MYGYGMACGDDGAIRSRDDDEVDTLCAHGRERAGA